MSSSSAADPKDPYVSASDAEEARFFERGDNLPTEVEPDDWIEVEPDDWAEHGASLKPEVLARRARLRRLVALGLGFGSALFVVALVARAPTSHDVAVRQPVANDSTPRQPKPAVPPPSAAPRERFAPAMLDVRRDGSRAGMHPSSFGD